MPTARVAPLLAKPALRRTMRAIRSACDPTLGSALGRHLLAAGLVRPDEVVAGYWPTQGEIDILPLLAALAGRDTPIALPVTPARGHPLTFRRWRPGDATAPGRFGIPEPQGPALVPTMLLVPLLAFDRRGARLGYGGGFYDRTLAALGPSARAIGCGFAAQEVDMVPTGTHDRPMNAIATETGLIVLE